ncbi:MAG: hypothetical protein BGO26_01155 [Actinobacteria bacterium 69-20]|nr:MAG: hypothetical protein BGO26_01155 [Actinobacteria bacterium 69-20]
MYVLPAMLLYGTFVCYPMLRLVQYSFTKWDGTSTPNNIGLSNYNELIRDPLFWQAFRHNLEWMFAAIAIPTLIGLALAIVLARSHLFGRTIFRAVFFLPQILSSIVIAAIWQWLYSPSFGAINAALKAAGLSSLQQGWLGDTNFALPAVFIAWAWTAYGFAMVILIAAIQSVDEEYFDAAKIDGAGRLRQMTAILLPAIRRPLTVVMLMNAIAALQAFDLVFIMTKGGPINSTMVLALYVYQNAFISLRVGYGSAIAVVLGIVIVISSLVFLRIRGLWGGKE